MKSFRNLFLALLAFALVSVLTAETPSDADAVASLVAAPKPDYPMEARRNYFQGQGLFLVRFDFDSGRATRVSVIHSTSYSILDEAAVKALQRWQIRPHTYHAVKIPINFEMTGERAAAIRAAGNNLLYAPPPVYPLQAGAHGVGGKGRFRLIIDARTGWVTDVQTLETTHDIRLDAAAVKALRQWRFKANTIRKLIVPIDFSISYG